MMTSRLPLLSSLAVALAAGACVSGAPPGFSGGDSWAFPLVGPLEGGLLITPVFEDREPERIARTRALIRSTPLMPLLDRYLHSWWWWRRAMGLRGLGLVRMQERAPAVVAALDDVHADVRGAALDALADLADPMTLPAIVVRLHDGSLHRGRRAAALAAFGTACEAFLLDLADVAPKDLAPEAAGLDKPIRLSATTFGKLSYAVRVGKLEGENYYVTLESGGAEKDRIFTRHVLLVPKSRLEDTLKKRDELIEKKDTKK